MERTGERLRRRREELGFTIEDIAEATKFRPEAVRAVEEGRTDVFPAEAYLKAFLKAYATKLGLDPGEIVSDQKTEEERVQEAIRGIKIRPLRRTGGRRRPIIIGIAAAVAVVVILWVVKPFDIAGIGTEGGPPPVYSHRPDTLMRVVADSGTAPAVGDTVMEPPAGEDARSGTPAGDGVEVPVGDHARGAPQDGVRWTAGDDADGDMGEDVEGAEPDESARVAPARDALREAAITPEAEVPERTRKISEAGPTGEPPEESAVAWPSLPAEMVGGDQAGQAAPSGRAGADEAAGRGPESGPVTGQSDTETCLEITAHGGFFINIASGGETLLADHLTGGDRRTLYSGSTFVVVSLTDKYAVSMTLDGEPVDMPDSPGRAVYNLAIPRPDEAQ